MSEKLKKIFEEVFGEEFEDISTLDAKSYEKWDSLKHMKLIVSIEDSFDIEFEDDVIPKMTSFGAVENFLKSV